MRPFVIVVESDHRCDYAANGHNVPLNEIEAAVAPYRLDDKFTIVFDLDGTPPRILLNSEKGQPMTSHNDTLQQAGRILAAEVLRRIIGATNDN